MLFNQFVISLYPIVAVVLRWIVFILQWAAAVALSLRLGQSNCCYYYFLPVPPLLPECSYWARLCLLLLSLPTFTSALVLQ